MIIEEHAEHLKPRVYSFTAFSFALLSSDQWGWTAVTVVCIEHEKLTITAVTFLLPLQFTEMQPSLTLYKDISPLYDSVSSPESLVA